jgi:7,8-dihydro-6-hydroxymethylpterin-pyrophosphokinase
LRRFVLVPLVELAPDSLHPMLGRSFGALLDELSDASIVRRWPSPIAPGDTPAVENF